MSFSGHDKWRLPGAVIWRETPDRIAANRRQDGENAHLGQFSASFNTTNLHARGLHVSPFEPAFELSAAVGGARS